MAVEVILAVLGKNWDPCGSCFVAAAMVVLQECDDVVPDIASGRHVGSSVVAVA